MGDINQLRWIERHRARIAGPIIEIGARHYADQSSNDFRALSNGAPYLGVDMSAGDNVDQVVDFTQPMSAIDAALGAKRFSTVLCFSVMEHVSDVFTFARNLSGVTAPGGVLFLSVPFTWRFHGYPSDYWRFTPKAIDVLFPDFEFDRASGMISSNVVGDTAPLPENPNDFAVRPVKRGFFGRMAFGDYKYWIVPSMISVIGVKKR